jgi:ppGpp synthetase/RelA/SpoT-type nucleotidyltranferase
MKSIRYKVERISIISDKFNDIRKDLISNQLLIVDRLKEIIDKYSEEYDLTKSNSVRKLRFYSLVARVKETESFSEKLIRNNDYNIFDSELDDLENINIPELKNKIKQLDDLIGIKILTDLNTDSINMFKLISSSKFLKEAKDSGIEINAADLDVQPVKMKNGLNIFKLRCKYEAWNFELQIKSKLESAWGDMEHSIFYKDYKLTPVRDLAQQSMNHIGQLLIEIDSFLEEIREANDNFSDNSKAILFSNNFEAAYSTQVSKVLSGISYNFKKIASLSYNIAESGVNILGTENVDSDYLSLECVKYAWYINLRNEDFDLQIFEAIILSNMEGKIEEQNLEQYLDRYFEIIKRSYIKTIENKNIIQDPELAEELVTKFFEVCISNKCKEFVLNTKNVLKHIENLKLFYESIEVLEFEPNEKIELLNTYTIFCFNGDLDSYIQTINKYTLLENLEKTKAEIGKITVVENNISENLNSLINILG